MTLVGKCIEDRNKIVAEREEREQIVAVGGCDRDGYCGVTTKEGLHPIDRFPSIGQVTCVKWEDK